MLSAVHVYHLLTRRGGIQQLQNSSTGRNVTSVYHRVQFIPRNMPAKQPWWIWINTSSKFIMNDCITTTKQSTTKPCVYFLGYTVYPKKCTHGLWHMDTYHIHYFMFHIITHPCFILIVTLRIQMSFYNPEIYVDIITYFCSRLKAVLANRS